MENLKGQGRNLRVMASNFAIQSKLQATDMHFKRRKAADRIATVALTACAAVTVSLLLVILGYIFYKGITHIDWHFVTSLPKPAGEPDGGISNALAGSLIIVALASLMAMPIGIGTAIFLNEFPSFWAGRAIRFLADVLTAVPSIVIGLAVYSLVVTPMKGFSGLSGAVAYAFIMIPIIVITAQEALRLVPSTLREASLALGVPRWRTILRIVLPVSSRALMTGLILAVARAMGETAPMLFTSFGNSFWNTDLSKPMATVPVVIYRYATGPYDDWHAQAWAAAFILVVVILLASIITRFVIRSKFDE